MSECPCYHCYFMEDLKARACKPEQCGLMDSWLSLIASEVSHSGKMENEGYNAEEPKRQSRHPREGYNHRMKHPQEIVDYARTLSVQYSTRDIAEKIRQRFNIKVSHVTILKWVNKPSQNA